MVAKGEQSSLGYSVFTPGTVLAARLPRDRGGRLRRRRQRRASARRRRGAFRARATRCTSRPASGTRSRTRATRTSSWSSASRTPTTRRRNAGDDLGLTAQSVREQVAWACRILALEGYCGPDARPRERRPADGETIYIKRKGVALDEVEPRRRRRPRRPDGGAAPGDGPPHGDLRAAARRGRGRPRPSSLRDRVRRDERAASSSSRTTPSSSPTASPSSTRRPS